MQFDAALQSLTVDTAYTVVIDDNGTDGSGTTTHAATPTGIHPHLRRASSLRPPCSEFPLRVEAREGTLITAQLTQHAGGHVGSAPNIYEYTPRTVKLPLQDHRYHGCDDEKHSHP